MILHAWPGLLCAALVAAAAAAGASAASPTLPPVTLGASPSLVVEVVVADKKGAPVEDLRARDFEVSVDGQRRGGVALARLYRGPGAALLASSRTTTKPGEVAPISEPSRVMVLVVDQASFAPGDEARARSLAETWLGMVGLSDRVAVIMLPTPPEAAPVSFERADVERSIRGVRALRLASADALGATDASEGEGTGGSTSAAGSEAVARDQAHAISTLSGLRQVLAGLRAVPGGKTVFLLSAGLVASGARADAHAIAAEAARAQVRISVLEVPAAKPFSEVGSRDLELLARDTGGFVIPPVGKPETALLRMAGQLAFSYLLILSPQPGDAGPDPHTVRVAVPGRHNLTVLAPAQVAPGRVSAGDLTALLSPQAAPPPRSPLAPGPGGGEIPVARPVSKDAGLDGVLARVSQYVFDYGEALTSIVAEETYTQEVHGGVVSDGQVPSGPKKVTLTSDYLLVKIAGLEGWLPFRDVFAVDGTPVRDRQDRLVKLFLEAPSAPVALERANQVWQESARYNIGGIRRTINAPLLPLWFLESQSLRRFAFVKAGEETLAGTRVWVIGFTETVHPTFIKTPEGADLIAKGRIWVEPVNGRIHRTLLTASMATITVNYGPRDEVAGLWLPVTMEERYEQRTVTIIGKATYSKFRQFRVTTDLAIAPAKK